MNRFWEKVEKTSTCWLWTGYTDKDGYGRFRLGKTNVGAHRYSYRIFYGGIGAKLSVCHTCDNPSCVNPAHLWLGTNKDNVRDMFAKGRQPLRAGSRHHKAKLEEWQIPLIRKMIRSKLWKQYQIADIFKVTQGCIGSISVGHSWKHL